MFIGSAGLCFVGEFAEYVSILSQAIAAYDFHKQFTKWVRIPHQNTEGNMKKNIIDNIIDSMVFRFSLLMLGTVALVSPLPMNTYL